MLSGLSSISDLSELEADWDWPNEPIEVRRELRYADEDDVLNPRDVIHPELLAYLRTRVQFQKRIKDGSHDIALVLLLNSAGKRFMEEHPEMFRGDKSRMLAATVAAAFVPSRPEAAALEYMHHSNKAVMKTEEMRDAVLEKPGQTWSDRFLKWVLRGHYEFVGTKRHRGGPLCHASAGVASQKWVLRSGFGHGSSKSPRGRPFNPVEVEEPGLQRLRQC